MENMNKRLVLIDGNSLMFRSYYATANSGMLMETSSGLYTNSLYGFVNMTYNIFSEEKYAFVAFDAGKQTFRHQDFVDYKATRRALPDELRVQIPYIKKYLDVLKVKRLEDLNYEADDLIASCANKFKNDFSEIKIITGDKDLLQLVDDKVTVYLTKKGISELEEYNKDNFYEKLGFYPHQVTDYKGMVGDTSDNLPGIKGVGDKTATKLLAEYGSLENIIRNVDELQGALKERFIENQDMGIKCKELATLKSDIGLDFTVSEMKLGEYDMEEFIKFLEEVEFKSILKKFDYKPEVIKHEYKIIDNPATDLSKYLVADSYLVFEVFGDNYYKGEFLGFSFVSGDNKLFITPLVLRDNKQLKQYLEGNYKKKVFDAKLIHFITKKYNINLNNVIFDFMVATYLLNPKFSTSDFKASLDNFGRNEIQSYSDVYGANTKMRIPDLNTYSNYSIGKALKLVEIEDQIINKLSQEKLLDLLLLELNLAKVLAKIEQNGLLVDLSRLNEIGEKLKAQVDAISLEIYELAGEKFNLNSPKQLGVILFEKLNLPSGKKNKTGYSTNVDVLEKLAVDFPIAKKILEYRSLHKLMSTYVNGIKEVTNEDSYIHPIYKQTETLTGRLSSIEPNIQNMPIRTEEGQVIREIFVSRFPGGKILSADYSQIELRVLAHLSNDPEMIDSFEHGDDFHSQTASRLYEVDSSQVTKEMRRIAKAINFGIIYGMSAWGLSETINITPLEANVYINKYFDTYLKAKQYLDNLVASAKDRGYTETILSRRRYIPELEDKNVNIRSFGERTAMNAPIQGSAADIIKLAMVKIQDRLDKEGLTSLMIAQVHDELLFDCPANEVEKMQVIVKEEMENAIKLKVKLVVDVSVGYNWANAK